MTASAAGIIKAYNVQREPERLALKMAAMRSNVFSFYRGTAHLFWLRVIEAEVPATAPAAWCSGDLHLENYGTYHGDNELTYFDVNDFDESALAPCDWEILRFLTSILIAGPAIGLSKAESRDLATICAKTYVQELSVGKARWIERKTAFGAIGDLMDDLKKRDPTRFLNKRTILKKGRRALDPDNDRMLEATPQQLIAVAKFIRDYAATQPDAKVFALLDARRRIAGTGSLGLERFVLLVEGSGSPDGNLLLDLKETMSSSLAQISPITQPAWPDEASRVVGVQRRSQAIAPARLAAVMFEGKPFLLKELQPSADRLDLAAIASDRAVLHHTFEQMARLVAWAQVRSSGRGGSAIADALIDFGAASQTNGWIAKTLENVRALAAITSEDFAGFRKAG